MSHEQIVDDIEQGKQVATSQNVAVAVAGEELNQLIMTAKANPRSVGRFTKSLKDMVTVNREMAESCHYTLERKQKDKKTGKWGVKLIVGASVRFAEVAMTSWHNMRAASQIVGEHINPRWDEETKWGFLIAEGAAVDLETNTGSKTQVRVRVEMAPHKGGLELAFVAAQSKAKRNAILQMIPRGLWLPIFEESKKVAAGGDVPLPQRVTIIMDKLVERGAEVECILARVGRERKEDVDEDALLVLITAYRQIFKHEMTVSQLFPPLEGEGANVANQALSDLGQPKRETTDTAAEDVGVSKESEANYVAAKRARDERAGLLKDVNKLILEKGAPAWRKVCEAESLDPEKKPELMGEDELMVVLDALKA